MAKKVLYLLMGGVLGFATAYALFYAGGDDITKNKISASSALFDLEFTESEQDSMLSELENNRESYKVIRSMEIKNEVPPSLIFNPIPVGKTFETERQEIEWEIPGDIDLPDNPATLAFYNIPQLASLLRDQKITSVELTEFFLERIREHGDTLEAFVAITEERALEQARKADEEIQNGTYKGPLHGIPYGAKDLFAVEGYKTTWGAAPYRDQEINATATIIEKLDEAGAVLVGKTTLGALAYGDVWFGGMTRSPWNLERGSSGSSAGSASATAAGLLPFAIGTETWGSIVSPATRNGNTGLRPTFGRVSRYGAMALSWSMDKVGPLTRTVEDAAIVFEAIQGPDGMDQSVIDLPFNYRRDIDLDTLKIGYLESAFEQDYPNKERDEEVLAILEDLGAELVPIELPDMSTDALSFILTAEAATAFDELTLSGQDDEMVRQDRNAWPNLFRSARFIPAVEYIQANRLRYQLIQRMEQTLMGIDLYVSPTYGGNNLLLTNLTGHPSVVLPNGFNEDGEPTSITFMGHLFDEATLLAAAQKYQQATDFHQHHPPLFLK